MRTINGISSWTLAITLVFLGLTAQSGLQADPIDDFTFSQAHAPAVGVYQPLSEPGVTAILADRLDVFPFTQMPRLARHLLQLCRKHRFDPAFVLSMIQVESGFHVAAVSPAGAVGLMQLMPSTAIRVARHYGIPYLDANSLKDPFTSLSVGVAYLATLRDRYRELPPFFHIAAYNIGPARVDELLSRKSFKPVRTKKYYEDIRRGAAMIRALPKYDKGPRIKERV